MNINERIFKPLLAKISTLTQKYTPSNKPVLSNKSLITPDTPSGGKLPTLLPPSTPPHSAWGSWPERQVCSCFTAAFPMQ
jgi:hypothetical protein